MNSEYQVVLELPCLSEKNYDLLIELEKTLSARKGSDFKVDGHDVGGGVMNIFLFSDNPHKAAERIKSIVALVDNLINYKIASRKVGDDSYVEIYPQAGNKFILQ